MTQRVVVVMEDDLDKTEGATTVTFGLDGTSYEIDLNGKNEAAMRKALKPYVDVARKVGGKGRRKRGDGDAAKIREWARSQGRQVPERGRIPREVREAYEAA